MPTYSYQCQACQHNFDIYQSIKAEPLINCPECQKESLQKLISGGAGYFVKDSGVLPDAKPTNKNQESKKVNKKEEPPHNHNHGHHHCHHH